MGAEHALPVHVVRNEHGMSVSIGPTVIGLAGDAAAVPEGAAMDYVRKDIANLDAPDAAQRGDLVVPGSIVARSYPGGLYRYRVEAAGAQITGDDTARHRPGDPG